MASRFSSCERDARHCDEMASLRRMRHICISKEPCTISSGCAARPRRRTSPGPRRRLRRLSSSSFSSSSGAANDRRLLKSGRGAMPMRRIMSDGREKPRPSHRRISARQRKDRLSSSAKNSCGAKLAPSPDRRGHRPSSVLARPSCSARPWHPCRRRSRAKRGGWGPRRNANGLKRCGCSCCCVHGTLRPRRRRRRLRPPRAYQLRNVEMKPSSLLPRILAL